MRCLGILSVRREADEKNKRRITISQAKTFNRGIPVVVAEFSATCEMLGRKSPWQKRRLFRKGEKLLYGLGAEVIVPTLLCSRAFGIPVRHGMMVETGLTWKDMPEALDEVFAHYPESPRGKTGWLVDLECRPESLPLLKALSRRVEFLNIVTDAREKGEEMAETVLDEYGIVPDVYRKLQVREWDNTLLVRLDTGRILIDGRTALRGRKWTLDLDGYQVDLSGLLDRSPELWDALIPAGWCRGKSG